MARWWCYSLQMVVVALLFMVFLTINPVTSQPQANLLLTGCSQINATNLKNFFGNLNETFRDLRSKLSNDNTYFATSEQTKNWEPVYSLAQCRKYMSMSDCLSCLDSADKYIRSCAAAIGGRAFLDGCFLRYESNYFYDQTTLPGNIGLCSNDTSPRETVFKTDVNAHVNVFETTVNGLLSDLSIATPKINGFYAAVTTPVSSTNTSTVYAIAQCLETVTRDGCRNCLQVAFANIRECAFDVIRGRAADAGCFMRYSTSAFFSNNKTTDITSFLRDGSRVSLRIRVCIGVGSAVLVILLMYAIYHILKVKHLTVDDKSVEAFVKQYGSLATKRYKYVDVKKMTNSFRVKLGQGGFGTVFKGKLSDGRLVAVKVLSSSKSTGKEFINEVSSIGRTSHVNIVNLLGFCFEYKKRALIYEFMPNGSLEKIINGHVPIGINKLYEIAFGIAQGLNYLHRGCNTRILHLDIKPHNILLDEEFCPKIADFGLAKLYSRKDSVVSMLEARGTIGYIAPEVFNRNFGGVSHKSDVYSYGMLILEMVGGRKKGNADIGSGQTSEYFPDWIYNRLEKDEFLLDSVTTTQEKDYARKMILVGLWCIQAYPSQRPSIDEVIKMLEGSMEELDVPPKPFFHSPSRSPATMLTASESEPESNYS